MQSHPTQTATQSGASKRDLLAAGYVPTHRPITIDEIEARLKADPKLNRPPRHIRIGASPPIHWAEMVVMALVAAGIGAMLAVML